MNGGGAALHQYYLSDLAKVALEARSDVRDADTARHYLELKAKIRAAIMGEGAKK